MNPPSLPGAFAHVQPASFQWPSALRRRIPCERAMNDRKSPAMATCYLPAIILRSDANDYIFRMTAMGYPLVVIRALSCPAFELLSQEHRFGSRRAQSNGQ